MARTWWGTPEYSTCRERTCGQRQMSSGGSPYSRMAPFTGTLIPERTPCMAPFMTNGRSQGIIRSYENLLGLTTTRTDGYGKRNRRRTTRRWRVSQRIGYPVEDVRPTGDTVGRVGLFEGGAIYWHPDTEAYLLGADVYAKWQALRGEQGPLGSPLADETPTVEDGRETVTPFTRGRLFIGMRPRGSTTSPIRSQGRADV